MGGSNSTETEEKLERATPHLNNMEQAMVKRLMEGYPALDQLMAETIVWKYYKEHPDERAETERLFATHTEGAVIKEGCNAPPSGTPPASASSPPPTSEPPSAS